MAIPAGIAPCPDATTAAACPAVSPLPASAGPTSPEASAPWHPAQFSAKTVAPRATFPAAGAAVGADGSNGTHFASPKVAAETTRRSAKGLAGLRIRTRSGRS